MIGQLRVRNVFIAASFNRSALGTLFSHIIKKKKSHYYGSMSMLLHNVRYFLLQEKTEVEGTLFVYTR